MNGKPVNMATFNKLRKLSLNDFNRWVAEFYRNAFTDGVRSAQSVADEVIAELPEDVLLEAVKSVSGIGEKRAAKVVEAIIQKGKVMNNGQRKSSGTL